ncbi:unnamed protein product [Sphagnum balticum]
MQELRRTLVGRKERIEEKEEKKDEVGSIGKSQPKFRKRSVSLKKEKEIDFVEFKRFDHEELMVKRPKGRE